MKHMKTFAEKDGIAPQMEVPTNMTAASKIEALGMPADVSQKHVGNADVYIVYSGPYPNAQVASAMQKLEEKGFSNVRSMPVPSSGKSAKQ